jgi:hypothetical protein
MAKYHASSNDDAVLHEHDHGYDRVHDDDRHRVCDDVVVESYLCLFGYLFI